MIEIRRARPRDASTIVGFQVRMARETEGMELDPATVERGVQAVFDDPSKGAYWLAELDGEVVASTLVLPEWSDWRNGIVLWIHSLYVVPPARRRGVFRALFLHLKRRVQRSDGLKGLRLYVDRRNRVAQAAYEAMGLSRERYQLYEWLEAEDRPRPEPPAATSP
ncbi:MAG: GNAT family N-acetyltransferase [Planctomycetota bacterium]